MKNHNKYSKLIRVSSNMNFEPPQKIKQNNSKKIDAK